MKFRNKKLPAALVSAALLHFATGVAQAYYNPQAGRWLSRDPAGEPGFQVLQAASGAAVALLSEALPALPQGRWFHRDSELRSGPNLYGFVGNGPVSHWDSLGLLTAMGGTPHTSLRRHNNYLFFKITCPKCYKFANWSVDYSGALSGLQVLGLDNDMFVDAFGSFSGASDLGGKRDAKTPNCKGQPVDVTVFMRTRLSNQAYLNALHLEFGSVDGFPALSATQTVGAYVAGTVITYDCVPCSSPRVVAPWWP